MISGIITLITATISGLQWIQDGLFQTGNTMDLLNFNNISNQFLVLWDTFPDLLRHTAFFPFVMIGLVFWPLLLSLLYTFMAASTWIVWLVTSFILGWFQCLYVAYQFVMITADLCGFFVLKSYSMICLAILMTTATTTNGGNVWWLYLPPWFNNTKNKNCNSESHQAKSERRIWRERLDAAGSYENFLKIRIEPKKQQQHYLKQRQDYNIITSTRESGQDQLTARSKKRANAFMSSRSSSFDNTVPSSSVATSSFLPKSSSFGNLLTLTQRNTDGSAYQLCKDDLHIAPGVSQESQVKTSSLSSPREKELVMDPVIAMELGERTAYVLITTTERLQDARRQAERACHMYGYCNQQQPESNLLSKENSAQSDNCVSLENNQNITHAAAAAQEAWDRLQYLLSAVMKRNHLQLESLLVDNAQTINNTGRYGLSNPTRQAIRAFYEQVEKGLDFLADAPIIHANKMVSSATFPLLPPSHQLQQLPETKESSANPKLQGSDDKELQEDDVEEKNEDLPSTPNFASPPSSPVSSNAAASVSSLSTPDQQRVSNNGSNIKCKNNEQLLRRIRILRKMKHNMGRTALMLSGGGAQAMYHIGVVRALIESKLYSDIPVISGTSGGSITAAMCAMKTPQELFQHICVPNVSTDYMSTGEQQKQNIRWFPTAMEMASYWFKNKLLINNDEFRRTCEFYYGDVTFEEAFEKTGKHVCISVSASRANTNDSGALQRLLLNHISTPRVTLASAVAASCALPGVMAPTKLMVKNTVGELEPFEVDGVDWIDGSLQADIPFQRISTMFAVSNFIVSQTNFYIVPLLNKEIQPDQKSLYRRLLLLVEWDIRSRALKLSRLGLFPMIFGQDMSKAFEQKYHGNLTIVPRFTTSQTFGLQTLCHPSYDDMKVYIKYGEIATWPFLNAIRDMTRLEKVLDDCLNHLEHRLGNSSPDWFCDDVDSLANSSHHHDYQHELLANNITGPTAASSMISPPTSRVVKISSWADLSVSVPALEPTTANSSYSSNRCGKKIPSANGEKLRRKTKKLEEENAALKEKLRQLQQLVEQSGLRHTTT